MESLQQLNDIRLARIKEASEKRDVDELMSWHSQQATFTDAVKGYTIEGWENIRGFYAKAYQAIPSFRIQTVKITGPTPDFVALEMHCEGELAIDLPAVGLKSGDTMKLRGVSLFWWKWEGEGDQWNGDLSEAAVRGWKIVEERAYHSQV